MLRTVFHCQFKIQDLYQRIKQLYNALFPKNLVQFKKTQVKGGENTKNHPGMSIAKITEAFKDKRFVQHESLTMNVYCDKYAKI